MFMKMYKAYTLIWKHQKFKYHFNEEISPVLEVGIAFWGLKIGQKQEGRCLRPRTTKTNQKTTQALKQIF